jgi:dimeric dUTPase (all-alpha-NTP-PPase superfamily)
MNLEKLFQMQKELGKVGLFNYRESDRLNKLILALLVELGECANEWRGFKFWSVNQIPHTSAARVPYMDLDDADFYNPLLEEYVDGLHFLLEIGLSEFKTYEYVLPINYQFIDTTPIKEENVTEQFNSIYTEIGNLNDSLFQNCYTANSIEDSYGNAFRLFLGLGEMLGFTWEQIEQAYLNKNQINHQRQENGY